MLDDTSASMALFPGLIALVASALLAGAVVALAIRRRRPVAVDRARTRAGGVSVTDEVAEILHRRTLRRSRMLADDDATGDATALCPRAADRGSRAARGHDDRRPRT